jgi:hypothetical protein
MLPGLLNLYFLTTVDTDEFAYKVKSLCLIEHNCV